MSHPDPPDQPYQRPGPYPSEPADDRNYRVSLQKHTGAIVLFHMQNYTVTGTLAECERAYRDAQGHNLLAGWWSPLSLLLFNWLALLHNFNSIRYVRSLGRA